MMNNKILFILLCSSFLFAKKTPFEAGVRAYETRDAGSFEMTAQNGPINYAIKEFKKAQKDPNLELDAGVYLLRCYYYKGKFVVQSEDEKKEIFQKGKLLGESLIDKYPQSTPARYWYCANLGSWAEVYGIFAAAKEGVADIMKTQAEKMIELDDQYWNGGGYFMLGGTHLKSPYIPFLLSWPSNDKAVEYLTKSANTGVATPTQTVYLARALYKDGQKDAAKKLLNDLIARGISIEEPVEDFEQQSIAKDLLADWD